ncbi:hypothetical protein [Mangrovimonas sp. TPBH4]|uniref:hypothetical protein n=1 Tax=Mangrovimonas sp. TPBH4 TaxID=1645914 RepID=UPI0006B55028|nr:hypothetical protein [Mangrovimonas sp. TPBH4]
MKKTINLLTVIGILLISSCSNNDSNNEDFNVCNSVIEDTSQSQESFANADSDDYTELCEDYKADLQIQIELCGDEDGTLQAAIDALGSCEQNSSVALMTANLDGVQYNDMKPNGFNQFEDAIDMATFSGFNDYDYIKLQGNSTYAQIIPDNTSKEINIYIPENAWQEGTYNLAPYPTSDEYSYGIVPHIDIIFFYENNIQGYEGELGGTITITNFDLVSRIITGTFEFQYIKVNNNTEEVSGPFNCINGTFNYSLDEDYFD